MNPDPAPEARLCACLDRIAEALEARTGVWGDVQQTPPEGQAFSWNPASGFRPVRRPALADPSLLVGIERQKSELYGNVRRFIAGAPAHDTLLWGDRGTGKSTLVRSLLAEFRDTPLALAEVRETHIPDLPDLLDALEPDPRRWVIFLDDLAFRGPADPYQELKVLLEGGLEARPGNTLAIATANRRHLVAESFSASEEIHPEEAVAEAVSLADRFGLSLGFYPFDEPTYLAAVEEHLRALGVVPEGPAWRTEALRWALARGIRSGRTAAQAAREIAGRRALEAQP